ncbi:MAG: large conductance mechanosensitive channel protein MscL [Bacteriovoracaceae bacterium]|nr:large conductance mechanosensitive channel protein MscL [Bacteriovoracaceae bacterium]
MSMMKEFKDFAVKGNVVDMAVGLIIGAAFKAIVSSFVKDVVMPPIGKALGNVDFSKLFINLSDTAYATLAEATKAGAPVIKYGVFIQTIVDFIIIAFVIFMVVKGINATKKKEEEAPSEPAPTPEDIVLLREIRDSLKK